MSRQKVREEPRDQVQHHERGRIEKTVRQYGVPDRSVQHDDSSLGIE